MAGNEKSATQKQRNSFTGLVVNRRSASQNTFLLANSDLNVPEVLVIMSPGELLDTAAIFINFLNGTCIFTYRHGSRGTVGQAIATHLEASVL